MTIEQRKSILESVEKKPMQSKKFIAFLFMEILLAALAMVALFTQPQLGWPLATFMSLIIMTMGAIALTFNGFQAAMDKYLRGAALTGTLTDALTQKVSKGIDAAGGEE